MFETQEITLKSLESETKHSDGGVESGGVVELDWPADVQGAT